MITQILCDINKSHMNELKMYGNMLSKFGFELINKYEHRFFETEIKTQPLIKYFKIRIDNLK